MDKFKRVLMIMKFLDELYPDPPIPLHSVNSYTFLVAVVLSAQSTDKKVNELTKVLFTKADNPIDMVNLGINGIYQCINKLGLARNKSKNIYNLSSILIKSFNNKIPDSCEELESLPGVGHKTASVVMSQIYGVPSFPVDTHIHRLAQRWKLSSGKNVKQTEKDLKLLFPKQSWSRLHLQFIYYGREHCSARNCDGTKCLLCRTLFPNRKIAVTYLKA